MSKQFELMKVFRRENMPADVLVCFRSLSIRKDYSPHSYVQYTIQDPDSYDEETGEQNSDHIVIDNWLIANGAIAGTDEYCGEDVLIANFW